MFSSSVLRIKSFRDLWLGQAISQLGDAFYYVTFMFMAKKMTGSDAMVGAVGAMETLPYLLFGPFSGVLADRADRRSIMLWSDLASAAVLAVFALTVALGGACPAWALIAIAFALSTVRCFFLPAKSAAIPALVPPEMMLRANALSATTQNLMPLIGLSLSAGVLSLLFAISQRGFYAGSIGLNALSFFVSAWFIARLPRIVPDRSDVRNTHPVRDFRDGVRYVVRRHDLAVLTALLTVFRLSVAPFFVAYVACNDRWFGGKPQTLTWMEASFFLGMVIASPIVGKLRVERPGLMFSNGLAFAGFTVLAFGIWPYFWSFMFWNFLAGLAIPLADIPIATYVQTSVPDMYRGRVQSVINTLATGVMPVGLAVGGALIGRVGPANAFMGMGAGMMMACLIGLLDPRFRSIRMAESPSGGEQDAEDGMGAIAEGTAKR